MNKHLFTKHILASSITLAIVACGGGGGGNGDSDDNGGNNNTGGQGGNGSSAGDVLALTETNRIISFSRDTPSNVRTNVAITGLQSEENLVGIDYRPADGMLYGVGSTGRIYTINTETGAATLKSTLAADPADTSEAFTSLTGSEFGLDFNPVADRLRIVSNTGQNLRINVDTGATTTDGAINGGAANAAVTASAYTNSFATTGTTTLYAIDSNNDTLFTQNPPNDGTLSMPVALDMDAGDINGFDIDARTNTGYAVFTVDGESTFYRVDLAATANPATMVGALGVTEDIRGLAVPTPQAAMVYGLTAEGRLVAFKPLTPNTLESNTAITGLNGEETLLGIDVRPKDGMLYGITSEGRIYTIDPATGVATSKATLSADAADTTAPFTDIAGTQFAVDFNPVADRLRVISDTGQNLRINVDTGATTTDGTINQDGASPLVTAAAYTNSFDGTMATMLLDIDTSSDNLARQDPPNDGTLVNVGALGLDAMGDGGMDIAGGANGLVLAALRASAEGATSLYRINMTSGAATLVNGTDNPGLSLVGTGTPELRDIAILLK